MNESVTIQVGKLKKKNSLAQDVIDWELKAKGLTDLTYPLGAAPSEAFESD
jgi:hypothetical protein